MRVEFTASTGIPSTLAPRVQVELLRIISEALTNVRKHADATTVRVVAEASGGELLITVTDNGRGFAQAEAFDSGMGLQGMRERARLIGGILLRSGPRSPAGPPSRCGRRSWRKASAMCQRPASEPPWHPSRHHLRMRHNSSCQARSRLAMRCSPRPRPPSAARPNLRTSTLQVCKPSADMSIDEPRMAASSSDAVGVGPVLPPAVRARRSCG